MRLDQRDIELARQSKAFLLAWREKHRSDFILALEKIRLTPNELKEAAIAKMPPLLRGNLILTLME